MQALELGKTGMDLSSKRMRNPKIQTPSSTNIGKNHCKEGVAPSRPIQRTNCIFHNTSPAFLPLDIDVKIPQGQLEVPKVRLQTRYCCSETSEP